MIIKRPKATVEEVLSNSVELIKHRKSSKPSYGEKTIARYLKSKRLKYIREHWFKDCFNNRTKHLLFFDFYIPELNMCIEFQGAHHYPPHLTDEQRWRDKLKVKYCRKRGIKLLVVHYMDLKAFAGLFKRLTITDSQRGLKKKIAPKKAERKTIKGFNMISEERHNEIVGKKKTGGKKHAAKMFRY